MLTVPSDFIYVIDLLFDQMHHLWLIIETQWIAQIVLFIVLIAFCIKVFGDKDTKNSGKGK